MEADIDAEIVAAVQALMQGGIIAYPTEAVYGLGCDPQNPRAVEQILVLKQRQVAKGLIVIASEWEQIVHWVAPLSPSCLSRAWATWPGPYTWVFPASPEVPAWIRGAHDSVALRVTAHPVASRLCRLFGGPLVSTSANVAGFPPARDLRTVTLTFPEGVTLIVPGEVGPLASPTEIRDILTGEVLRGGRP